MAEAFPTLFQPSLRDFIGGGEVPGDKSPGHCQLFLRNNPEAETPVSTDVLH
jgi:hypothetical protein